jgi:hypothetical protein
MVNNVPSRGRRGREVAKTMYTHVHKCKNDKLKKEEKMMFQVVSGIANILPRKGSCLYSEACQRL